MKEVTEVFIRTTLGKIHRVMSDSEGLLYAWKRCRLLKVEYAMIPRSTIEDADTSNLCSVCM